MQNGLVTAKLRQHRAASHARVTGEERPARTHIKASSAQSRGGTGLAQEFLHPQPRIWQPENQNADGRFVPWGRCALNFVRPSRCTAIMLTQLTGIAAARCRNGAGPSILVEGFVFQRQHYNESFISINAPLVASVASQRPPSTPWPDPILDERWLAVRLRHMPSTRAAKLCTAANTINGTALFVYRDHPNFFHTVLLQMLPAYWTLKAYGLEHQNFNMIYLDYESYNHIFYARSLDSYKDSISRVDVCLPSAWHPVPMLRPARTSGRWAGILLTKLVVILNRCCTNSDCALAAHAPGTRVFHWRQRWRSLPAAALAKPWPPCRTRSARGAPSWAARTSRRSSSTR